MKTLDYHSAALLHDDDKAAASVNSAVEAFVTTLGKSAVFSEVGKKPNKIITVQCASRVAQCWRPAEE